MDLRLAGKVAVVTGGSSGIGFAAAKLFLEEGAYVAICGRDTGRLSRATRLLDRPDRVLAFACDVLDEAQVTGFRDAVLARFGNVSALVCNAGAAREGNFFTNTDVDWDSELRMKFLSYVYPIRTFLASMRVAGNAAVVCVNSTVSTQPESHLMTSSAARAGVLNLAKSLSRELAPEVRVNSIQMGPIASGQWERRYEKAAPGVSYAEWLTAEAAKRDIPLKRFGEPAEAADAIVYLASPRSSFVTGARLEVSGGVTRHI